MMQITNQLIYRFFRDQCTPEEVEEIVSYFDQHPEVLEQYMGEEEWQQFSITDRLHPAVDNDMWKHISAVSEQTARKYSVLKTPRWVAAAAVTILIAVSAYLFVGRNKHPDTFLASSIRETTVVVNNTTPSIKTLVLDDGSTVYLQPNSSLQYDQPFASNRRLLQLTGQAFFKVAKDAARPFTVTSGGLTTTALGTSFWITAFRHSGKVNVRLYTGKVVIRKAAASSLASFEDVYLVPEQEMTFNERDNQTLVRHFSLQAEEAVSTTENKAVKQEVQKGLVFESGSLQFNNTGLAKVFKTLQDRYAVAIRFDKPATDRMYFSGKYKDTDSLDAILKTITSLNGLILEKDKEGFYIHQ
jgi:ferric-dicitrate binding protein FerR (iron transport regulator)